MGGKETKKRCLVIIPAYNEEMRIGDVIAAARAVDRVDEVVVIDDCSSDHTAEIARKAGATVVSLVVNLGYGAALHTGYKYSYDHGYDVTVQIDGDGQHDPRYIQSLIEALESKRCDVVVGSRFLGSMRKYDAPLFRRVGMRFFSFLIYLFTKNEITDPTSGYQALNRNVIELFARGNLYPSDYPDADVIILLNNMGFKIMEIPVVMYENKTGQSMHSGLKPLYYVVKMLLSIFTVLFGKHRTFLRRTHPCL